MTFSIDTSLLDVADDIQLTFSKPITWLHVSIGLVFSYAYISSVLEGGPLSLSLGYMPSICMFVMSIYHFLMLYVVKRRNDWVEGVIFFLTPFVHGAVWLLLIFSDVRQPANGDSVELASAAPVSSSGLPFPSPMLIVTLWYLTMLIQRNLYGIVVWERKIRHTYVSMWIYRIYVMTAPWVLVLAWRTLPGAILSGLRYLSSHFPYGILAAYSGLDDDHSLMNRMLMVSMVAGVIHVLWCSFISFTYRATIWKEYLREGIVVWQIGGRMVVSKTR
ncbi:hypothetical protein GQ42DRAFT_126181 [Ramicandelaber brevisporus]|nr:hypothetical protein GQ42DRAFT_126181 [Ramicandelaber brevisporus]